MFNRQTLFIVGAGASAEVDFPLGKQLAQSITAKMDVSFGDRDEPIGSGDYDLYSHIVQSTREPDAFWKAAMRISAGLPYAQSIDDFLDQHRNDPYLNVYGKAGHP